MQGLTNAASYWDNYNNIFSNDGRNTITGYTGTGKTPDGTVAGNENTTFTNKAGTNIITAVPNGTIDTVKSVAEYLDQIMPLIYQAAVKHHYMRETL